jgi:hypothetical protein
MEVIFSCSYNSSLDVTSKRRGERNKNQFEQTKRGEMKEKKENEKYIMMIDSFAIQIYDM